MLVAFLYEFNGCVHDFCSLTSSYFIFFIFPSSWYEHESCFQIKEDLVESENSQVFYSGGKIPRIFATHYFDHLLKLYMPNQQLNDKLGI